MAIKVWALLGSKNCLILISFIMVTSISMWLMSMPTPNIRTIMTETQKQITDNLKSINMMSAEEEEDTEEEEDQRMRMNIDQSYLELLGFTKTPQLYPTSVKPGFKVPIIVTGVNNKNYQKTFPLIDSMKKLLTEYKLTMYDLGLGPTEMVKLKKHCNESTDCQVKSFDFDKFPHHLRDKHIKAYKPVVIQVALMEYGAIVWTDTPEYFVTGDVRDIFKQAERTGVAAWPTDSKEPTSAWTHPKMFEYFDTKGDSYMFHHMVAADHLVLYNTEKVHNELMLPWVECALKTDCISPKGAQDAGCNSQRKPLYLYSGCHKFEVSALNVILGLMFEFDDKPYIGSQEIFGIIKEKDKKETDMNATTTNER